MKIYIIILKKEGDASISITKYRVKEEIRKSSTPFDIKLERIFNEISKEVGFFCVLNMIQ